MIAKYTQEQTLQLYNVWKEDAEENSRYIQLFQSGQQPTKEQTEFHNKKAQELIDNINRLLDRFEVEHFQALTTPAAVIQDAKEQALQALDIAFLEFNTNQGFIEYITDTGTDPAGNVYFKTNRGQIRDAVGGLWWRNEEDEPGIYHGTTTITKAGIQTETKNFQGIAWHKSKMANPAGQITVDALLLGNFRNEVTELQRGELTFKNPIRFIRSGALDYLKIDVLPDHYKALGNDTDSRRQLDAMLLNILNDSSYIVQDPEEIGFQELKNISPKTDRTTTRIHRNSVIAQGITGEIKTLPTGPAPNLINELLSTGDPDKLAKRKSKFNRNQKFQLEELQNHAGQILTATTGKTTVSLQINDIKKISSRNPQAQKIFTRIMIAANDQALNNGIMVRDTVRFSLESVIGEGQYKTTDTARKGVDKVLDILTDLKVKGKIEQGKKRTLKESETQVMFTGYKIKNSICEIYLNPRLNWQFIAPYYTGLPDYYFELPDRAAMLLEYIFYLARQNNNARQIAEKGYFTISYRAIQTRLNLPDEEKTKNPQRDIKDAIESAIERIEEKYKQYAPKIPENATGEAAIPEFSLLPIADYEAPIKKYLDDGKLQISLKGAYAENFLQIAKKSEEKIEKAKKRQEKIEDMAKAKNLAKHISETEE